MRGLLAFLVRDRRVPEINRAKPGPSRRQRDHDRIITKMRELRYELRMEFK